LAQSPSFIETRITGKHIYRIATKFLWNNRKTMYLYATVVLTLQIRGWIATSMPNWVIFKQW